MLHDLKRLAQLVALTILTAVGIACARPLAAQDVMSGQEVLAMFSGATAYEPPAVYATWWQDVLTRCRRIANGCQNPAIAYEQTEWFEMPADFVCDRAGHKCLAAAIIGSGQGIIDKKEFMNKRIVEHEMLHLILGTGDHGPEFDWLDLRAPGAL